MNNEFTHKGGWPASSMYTFVNNDIYNALPFILKNQIIDTITVSGYGSGSGDTENFTFTDKLYLLTPKEIYKDFDDVDDTGKDLTRTLDYYINNGVTVSNYNGAVKKNGSISSTWWLRTPFSNSGDTFYITNSDGTYDYDYVLGNFGVSPAFRIG